MTIEKQYRQVPWKVRVVDESAIASQHGGGPSQPFRCTFDQSATVDQPLMLAVPPRSRDVAGALIHTVVVRKVSTAKRPRSGEPGCDGSPVVVDIFIAMLDDTGRRVPSLPAFRLASFTFCGMDHDESDKSSAVQTQSVRLPLCPNQRLSLYMTTSPSASSSPSSSLVLCTLVGTGRLLPGTDVHGAVSMSGRSSTSVFSKMLKGGDLLAAVQAEHDLSAVSDQAQPSPAPKRTDSSSSSQLVTPSRESSKNNIIQSKMHKSQNEQSVPSSQSTAAAAAASTAVSDDVPQLTYAFVPGSDVES